ncbi:MAG: DUF5668 domain-containing protein [Tannerellaceae bacterium]|jgi:hypothetical protein|nr:DUF5668 domain-containing protein [Tannerellaceae bacterium]
MNTHKKANPQWHRKFDTIIMSLLFITAGTMLLGHNLGAIPLHVFRIVMSWQMLLIVLGLSALVKRNLTIGFILLTIGVFFFIPAMTGAGKDWFRTYWPVIFIIIGIVLLCKRRNFRRHNDWYRNDRTFVDENASDNGFVHINVSFGETKHIVLEPVFRGAKIDCSFASVSLDLRKTSLEAPQTSIDIDCSFGGILLFIPSCWNIVMEIDTTLSGCEDKRHILSDVDYEHKLIIKGDLTFSGIEIKS